MRPFGKLLILLFIVSFLLIMPIELPSIISAPLNGNSYTSYALVMAREYGLIWVTIAFVIVLAYSLARKYMGSHRALYALFGIVLLSVNYLVNHYFTLLYGQIVALLAIAAVDTLYVAAVWDRLSRTSFLSMSIPAAYLVIAYPLNYLELAGFTVFVCAFAVARSSIRDTVVFVNLRSVRRASAAAAGQSPSAQQPKPKEARKKRQSASPSKPLEVAGKPVMAATAAPAMSMASAVAASAHKPVTPLPATDLPSNIPWPGQSDYVRAMQNTGFSISAGYPDMRASKVVPNPFVKLPGNIVYSSGNYGTIFKLENSGSAQALKCFTRSKLDINRRYSEISKTLKSLSRKRLAFVDFQYLPGAVRTFKSPSTFFPVLLMDWVEGKNLNTYISEHLRSPGNLKRFAETFIDEMVKIRHAGIAHGDIAGDNIVIDDSGSLTLVDYDGMYIPAFSGYKSQELGHDNFQHPARSLVDFSERLDNFSILVSYLSLLAVAEDASLWAKYNKGDQDCLIFRKSDFLAPAQSPVLKDIRKLKGRVRDLGSLLEESLKHEPQWSGCDPQRILKT